MPDTLPLYSTRERARQFERYAARGVADNARDRKRDLQEAVNDTVRALRKWQEIGADKLTLADLLGFIHDEASNIDGVCLKDIDNAGETAEPVDLSEIDAMLSERPRMGM